MGKKLISIVAFEIVKSRKAERKNSDSTYIDTKPINYPTGLSTYG